MLTAGYTLAAGGHVRVDIFYSEMSAKGQALVDLLGTLLLLLPFCGFLIWSSWDYVGISWEIREASQETGGLPFPFPAIMKSFIPLTGLLLILQGIVIILNSVATLRADNSDHGSGEG
jgi:TRAP-type mannitol/chloroaromatic compound transport system permease small subunit